MGNYSLGEALLGTGIDLAGLGEGLAKAEASAKNAVGRIGGFFSNALSGALGFIGANVLQAGAGALIDFGKDSFAGALEAQQGLDRLGASIKRLGGDAPVTMDSALAMADSFKNLVGGSDDVVLAMTDVGLRFSSIGKDIFPRFIEQSADLATVLKMEPAKAAEFLGKTLQDMATDGTFSAGRLKAAGLTISESAEKQIAAMVEAGNTSGAMTLIMDELAKSTGGAAQAVADSASGQWAIFQETIADAGEGVMLSLLPALTQLMTTVLPQLTPLIAAVATAAAGFLSGVLLPAFMQAVAWVQTNWPAIQAAVEPVMAAVLATLAGVVAWVIANWPMIQATIAQVWAQVQPILAAAGAFITGTVIPIFQQAVAWVVTNWPMIQATIQTVMATIQTVITDVLTAVQTFWDTWGDEIMAAADSVFKFVGLIFSAFSKAFQGDWRGFGEELRKAWDLLWEGIKTIVSQAITWFTTQDWGAIGTGIIDGIKAGLTAAAGALAAAAKAAAEAAIAAVKGFLGMHSPSSVGIDIGQNLGGSQARGLLDSIPDIRAAARAAGNAMLDQSRSLTQRFELSVNTQQSLGSVTQDFALMRALAGV